MVDSIVGIRVKIHFFTDLVQKISCLPGRFRPEYFSLGERVRNKNDSKIDDAARFSEFLDDRVKNMSGFDLIGKGIRFGFFVGETRDINFNPTHVGCSILLRGREWSDRDLSDLLNELCVTNGLERGYACRREEWERRHIYTKIFPEMSIQTTLGVDMSAFLTGIYWKIVLSDELLFRHKCNIDTLNSISIGRRDFVLNDGTGYHILKFYDNSGDWIKKDLFISNFLKHNSCFFSMDRIIPDLERADTKEKFDRMARPFRAGAVPWTNSTIAT